MHNLKGYIRIHIVFRITRIVCRVFGHKWKIYSRCGDNVLAKCDRCKEVRIDLLYNISEDYLEMILYEMDKMQKL